MSQVFKLKEVRSIVSIGMRRAFYKGERVAISMEDSPYFRTGRNDWESLPRLKKPGQFPYRNAEQYLRHVDKLISKYGPDAQFESFDMTKDDDGYENQPIKEGGENEESQTKGVGKGLSFDDPRNYQAQTLGKGEGKVQANPSCSSLGTSGRAYKDGVAGSDTGIAMSGSIGSVGHSKAGSNPGKTDHGPTVNSVGDNQQTNTNNPLAKAVGVGSQPDVIDKDACRAFGPVSNSLKTTPKLEANSVTNLAKLDASDLEWGIHPHPTYSTSFSAYVKRPKYRLPPMLGIASSLSTITSSNIPWSGSGNVETSGGDFSTENRFGSGNPGGFVDEAFAKLHSKHLRAQTKSIQSRMQMIFRMNDVGIGQEETPRLSGKKLIKEIVSKAVRMSRTRKEERGSGLKLLLVDISPSCEAIRDACYAAAVSIADADNDVVVVTHFNGYMDGEHGKIIGQRHREIPPILNDGNLEPFEAFLSTGKLSGAIAFGDGDAAKLYGVIAKYAPLVWMTPFDEEHCRWAITDHSSDYCFDKASLYIVPDVRDARSAVKGMEAVLKAKKL